MLKEIDKLRKDLEKLEITNKTYQSNLSSKNVIITSLEGKIQSLAAALSSAESSRDSVQIELNTRSGALKTTQEQLQQMKKRCEVVEALGKVSFITLISFKYLHALDYHDRKRLVETPSPGARIRTEGKV